MIEQDNNNPLSIDDQFERLMKLEGVYDSLSQEKQGWIYEEFKRLLKLRNENGKESFNESFFFGSSNEEEKEPNYRKSKLYEKLLRRYVDEQVEEGLKFQERYNKLPKEKQKSITERFKRILRGEKNNKEKENKL